MGLKISNSIWGYSCNAISMEAQPKILLQIFNSRKMLLKKILIYVMNNRLASYLNFKKLIREPTQWFFGWHIYNGSSLSYLFIVKLPASWRVSVLTKKIVLIHFRAIHSIYGTPSATVTRLSKVAAKGIYVCYSPTNCTINPCVTCTCNEVISATCVIGCKYNIKIKQWQRYSILIN